MIPKTPLVLDVAMRHMRKSLCSRIEHALAEDDDGFARHFPDLVAAVEAGLRHEEAILECRNDAGLHARREDNATILCALHRIAPLIESGDTGLGRQVIAALHDVMAAHRLASVRFLAPAPQSAQARRHGTSARPVPCARLGRQRCLR